MCVEAGGAMVAVAVRMGGGWGARGGTFPATEVHVPAGCRWEGGGLTVFTVCPAET